MSETKSDKKDAIVTTNTIIVEMGAVELALIKQLTQGKGALMSEVNEIIDEVSDQVKDESKEKVYIPVVIIYERKNS